MTPTVPSCGDRSEEPYLFFRLSPICWGRGREVWLPYNLPSAEQSWGQARAPAPSLAAHFALGPWLVPGATDLSRLPPVWGHRPWEVLLQTANKDDLRERQQDSWVRFLGSQKGGGKGIDDFLEGGRRTWGWEGWPQGGALGNLGGRGGVNGHIRESLGSQGRRWGEE